SGRITDSRVFTSHSSWPFAEQMHGMSVFSNPSGPVVTVVQVTPSHLLSHPPPDHSSYTGLVPSGSGGSTTRISLASVTTSHWLGAALLSLHGFTSPPYRSASWSMACRSALVNRNVSMAFMALAVFTPVRMRPASGSRLGRCAIGTTALDIRRP